MRNYFILLVVGLALAYLSWEMVFQDCVGCYETHEQIVGHTAGSPYRYRQLVPGVVELLSKLMLYPDREVVNIAAYLFAHAAIMPSMLISVYAWLKRVTPRFAFAGALLLAVYVPVGYVEYPSYALWTMVEVILYSSGLLVLWSKLQHRTVIFLLLTVLATINRETGMFMGLLYFAADFGQRRSLLRSVGVVGAGVATYAALRFVLGDAEHVVTLDYLASINQQFAARGIVTNLLLLPAPLAVVTGWRRADRRLRRMALVSLIYIALVLIWGQWHEVRLWFPLFPVSLAFGQE